METTTTPTPALHRPDLVAWRTAQVAVWLVGVGIFFALLLFPVVGIDAFWNVLIPVAPALLAFAPGVWRNICPLASTALLPRHLGLSKRAPLSASAQAALAAYYWFRLPMLFGFGPHPGDGMLVDLRDSLPHWFPWASRIATTGLFVWWLVSRASGQRAWSRRPAYSR